jgi:hypothetical protein
MFGTTYPMQCSKPKKTLISNADWRYKIKIHNLNKHSTKLWGHQHLGQCVTSKFRSRTHTCVILLLYFTLHTLKPLPTSHTPYKVFAGLCHSFCMQSFVWNKIPSAHWTHIKYSSELLQLKTLHTPKCTWDFKTCWFKVTCLSYKMAFIRQSLHIFTLFTLHIISNEILYT